VVLELDALGSATMPALLLGAVPLLIIGNVSADVIGAVVLGFALVLGAVGAIIAWILGKAMARGDAEFPDTGWFFLRPLFADRSVPELTHPSKPISLESPIG
jgi:hypothetical protein